MVGSIVNVFAQKKAADVQHDTMMDAAGLQQQQFQQSRADLAPWRETGGEAVGRLGEIFLGEGGPDYSAFFKSPGYEFRFGEGIRAIDRSASARGRLNSGATGRELTRYGQGFASNEFNQYANRLAALAGIGQTSAAQTGQLGAQAAGIAGGHIANAGTARASGYSAMGNILQSTYNRHEGRGHEAGMGFLGAMGGMAGGGGGGGALAMMSSRKLKENAQPVDYEDILEGVRALEVENWNYKHDVAKRAHIGPYAEDFQELFAVGDGMTIDPVDAFGVLFAAVKELTARVRELEGSTTRRAVVSEAPEGYEFRLEEPA